MNRLSSRLSFLGGSLLPLVILVVVAAFRFSGAQRSDTLTLPIEVFPSDGASQYSESVSVDVSDPSGVETLYIQGHALSYHKSDYADSVGYDQKASFRINGGNWVPISNSTADCLYPDRLYNIEDETGTTPGCIGGPLHTLRLEVPVSETGSLVSGTNTIEFRFNGTDGFGSGYRILDFELRRSDGSNAIDGTDFVETDYDAWSAPADGDASNGKTLWSARNSLVEEPNGESIIASCADCHARDGRDLKFYNYSNKSIQARARFHGLSSQQAKDIAAYIRSVDLDLPSGYTVSDAGRPWDPPYQPGPNLADKPVELWAAGAGIEWVLDDEQEAAGTDRDMATYMIPGGSSDLSVVHPDSTLQAWKQPIAMQLPDWNNWLPDVHPFDVYGESEWKNTGIYDVYKNEIVGEWEDSNQLQSDIDQAIKDAQTCNKYIRGVSETLRRFTIDRWRTDYESLTKNSEYEGDPDPKIDELSDNQWMSVKMWEIHNRYHLQKVATKMYTPNNDCGRIWGGNKRSWVGNNNSLYNVAPHKNSKPEYPSSETYADSHQNKFFTSAWYELQLIVGPNQGNNDHGNPFDWNYHAPHIADHDRLYGHSQGLRQLRGQIVVQQQKSNYRTPENNDFDAGWNMHNMQPTRMFWTNLDSPLNSMDQSTRRDVTEAIMRAWITYTNRIPISDWPRGDDWGHGEVLPSSYTPTSGSTIGDAGSKADYLYRMMTKAETLGISSNVLNEYAEWGEAMWPNGDWEQWMTDNSSSTQSIALNPGWNLISSNLDPSSDSLSSIFSNVESDLAIIQNQQGDSYDPSGSSNTLETWDSSQGYRVYMNANQTLNLDGTALNSPSLSLNQGWNLIPFYPSSEMPVEDAFSSISGALEIVKDEAGNSYIPSRGLNEIGMLKPGHAYKVYVSTSTSFSYP